jgi:1-acyl-sn-glycerol-3-phosphate acyltransferase
MTAVPPTTGAAAGADNNDPWWYALIRSRLFEGGYEWVLRGLFRLRPHGTETLPRSGPVILCYNHGSHYDAFFMQAVGRRVLGEMPVPVIWQGTLQYPIVGSWLRAWRVVPIGRTSHTTARSMALMQMVLHLRHGRSFTIACEGKRLDALGPFRPGAAWAAMQTGVLVVPCSLRGVQPLFKKLPWPDKFRGNVEVHFHPPLDPRAFGSVDELTQAIRRAIASQIDYPLQENVGASGGGRPARSNTPLV